jgi:hypothetical protein
MKKILCCFAMVLGLVNLAYAQDAPQPCGPASALSKEFSKNVGSNARCFELRMYTAKEVVDGKGGIDNLHQRFREREIALFEKHGAEVIGTWQRLDDPNTLVWMLAYRNRAHRDQVFSDFAKDPEWQALRTKYDVPLTIEAYMMSSTDYSNLK